MNIPIRKWAALIVCLFFVMSVSLFAQERFGNLSGTVTDASGAVVPGAAVTLTNKATGRIYTTTTRGDGTYNAYELEPGHYSVAFSKDGFRKYEASDVNVLVGKTFSVPAVLKVGGGDTTVEVSDSVPVIDITNSTLATNVTIEELDRLPKARNFQTVAVLAPSVNTGQLEGGFQINGASAAENNYYIDGVSTNSVIDGSARQNATFDYIQEVQVKTTGFDAEYGGALGGVVTAVTKSGGNEFHGEGHYYYYGNKTAAGPTKRLQMDFSKSPTAIGPGDNTYFQDGKYRRDNHEIGGSLGGPLWKNKMWFYTSTSPRWLSQRNEYIFGDAVPTTGSLGRSLYSPNWFSKITFDPWQRVRMNFSYLYSPQYLQGSIPAYTGYGPDRTTTSKATAQANNRLGYSQAENSIAGQVDITVSNSSLLSIKGGRYFLNYKDTGVDADYRTLWGVSTVGRTDLASSLQRAQGDGTPTAAKTAHDLTTRTYIQGDFSQVARFMGQHNFKFGVGTTKSVNNVNDSSSGPLGTVTLFWGQPCNNPGCTAATTGTYGYYTVDETGTIGSTGSLINHFYVQDAWKVWNRLTINGGVRLEKETIPSFRPDIKQYAIQFGYGDKIAPRIGASFDVFGNGKLKISGGWGRYYDWTKYDVARGAFGADVWRTYYRTLDTTDPNAIFAFNLNNMPGTNMFASAFEDHRIPAFDTLDPSIKPMSQDAMNVGAEWEVMKNTVFSARYVRTDLIRTIEDIGTLDAFGSEFYYYGNPGEGLNKLGITTGATCPTHDPTGVCAYPIPKAKRQYDAMELSVNRAFSNGWGGNVSYVYSRLYGNYAGTQSTDEIRPAGSRSIGGGFAPNQGFAGQSYRPGGNANRYYDLDQTIYDAHGHLGNFGRLPTDRPHVLKIYGAKQFKFGTEIGTFFRVMSGTPITTQAFTSNGIGMYVDGRGDMGRTPVLSQTDLNVAHSLKVGEGKNLRFEFTMTNLFNQKTAVYEWDRYSREDLAGSTGINVTCSAGGNCIDLTKGFDYKGLIAATPGALDYRYGKEAMFNPGFEGRFGVKFTF